MRRYSWILVVLFIFAGCSKKTADNETQSTNNGQEESDLAANEENAGPRPFKFTVDLEKYYTQPVCEEDEYNCKSYKDLGMKPVIPIHVTEISGAKILYDLDCDGDGKYEQRGLTRSSECAYSGQTGSFQIAIRGEIPGLVLCGDEYPDDNQIGFSDRRGPVSIDQWGDIEWRTMHGFAQFCDLVALKAQDNPNLSHVTDMSEMFHEATAFNQPIDQWDVSHVTNMTDMFNGANAFNQPLNSWDVSHVTHMTRMFAGCFDFNQPLDKWNMSAVTDISYMFALCRSFNQPIGGWNVSSVTNMAGVFTEASSFNQPLDKWDVSHVTNMDGMFRGTSVFNQPIGNWDVSSVTIMEGMFNRSEVFNQPLDKWDVSHVTTMNAMFWGASSFSQNIDGWNVSAVRDMHGMFQNTGRKKLPKWFRE